MNPLISIILIVYNSEKFLTQCLDSLISQTFNQIEIICIDDASTDQSVDIIQHYQNLDDRIRLIQLSQYRGANYARNRALKKAKGDYVAILDGDDFYEKNFLEKLYTQAEKTKADITFCGFNLFDDVLKKSEKIEWDINRKILPKDTPFFITPKLFNLIPSFVWNQLYRREFIQKNHLSFANVRSFTDVYFNKTALLKAERISYVDERLIHYRVNNLDSISHNLTALDGIRTIYAVRKFLEAEGLYEKYQSSFFECCLYEMNRIRNLLEPYRSLLRSFYQKYLIPKLSAGLPVPETFSELKIFDTCSDAFKKFFFYKRDNVFPIIFATDEKNAQLTAVSIESIRGNTNPDYFYDIYILETDLSPATRFNFLQLSNQNVRVTCLNLTDKIDQYVDYQKYCFFIPSLFKGYNKILYLDNMVLVQDDLADLFKVDMGNNIVMGKRAILAPPQKRRYTAKLDLDPDKCISTDVLLWNIPQYRASKLTNDLMKHNENFSQLKPSAQEIINFTWQNQKDELPQKPDIQLLDGTEKVVPDAPLIQYSFRPWSDLSNPLSQNWLRVARKSLYYELIIRDWLK